MNGANGTSTKRSRDDKVLVTVLTRFLGSGKTTLLNYILNDKNHGMKFAVIQNEFGDVGVDDKILSEEVAEEVIEVMNGCICCTVRGDLVETLKKLYTKVKQFDGILIETTGLADPAPVVQTFFVDDTVKEQYNAAAKEKSTEWLLRAIRTTIVKPIINRLWFQSLYPLDHESSVDGLVLDIP